MQNQRLTSVHSSRSAWLCTGWSQWFTRLVNKRKTFNILYVKLNPFGYSIYSSHSFTIDESSRQSLLTFFLCQYDESFPFVVASHLCDTRGCVSEDHSMMKTKENNISRRDCGGIMIQLYQKSSGDYCIAQMKPCKRGRKLNKATSNSNCNTAAVKFALLWQLINILNLISRLFCFCE